MSAGRSHFLSSHFFAQWAMLFAFLAFLAGPARASAQQAYSKDLGVGARDSQALENGMRALLSEDNNNARAAFRNASRADSTSAWAWWGLASSDIPTRSFYPGQTEAQEGATALSHARRLVDPESLLGALVSALEKRYAVDANAIVVDPSAYLDALTHVAAKYNSPLAQELYAQTVLAAWRFPGVSQRGATLYRYLSGAARQPAVDPALLRYRILLADKLGVLADALESARAIDAAQLVDTQGQIAFAAALPYIAGGDYRRAAASSRRAFELDLTAARRADVSLDRMSYSLDHLMVWYAIAALNGLQTEQSRAAEVGAKEVPWFPAATAYTVGDYSAAVKVADVYGEGALIMHAPFELALIAALSYSAAGRQASAQRIVEHLQVERRGRPRNAYSVAVDALQGRVAQDQGNIDEARTIFARILPEAEQQSPETLNWWLFPVRYWLTDLERQSGHRDLARRLAVTALSRYPDDVRFRRLLAEIDAQKK